MRTEIQQLNKRLNKLEKQKNEEILTLVEILSNATFFGEIKKANCKNAKDGQCSYFILESEAKSKIPIISSCHIKNCEHTPFHCHLELSNITCSLCQTINNGI